MWADSVCRRPPEHEAWRPRTAEARRLSFAGDSILRGCYFLFLFQRRRYSTGLYTVSALTLAHVPGAGAQLPGLLHHSPLDVVKQSLVTPALTNWLCGFVSEL